MNPYLMIAALLGALMLFGIGVGTGIEWEGRKWAAQSAEQKLANDDLALRNAQVALKVSEDVLRAEQDRAAKAALVLQRMHASVAAQLLEVPNAISAEADARCAVPDGFVRLWNRALDADDPGAAAAPAARGDAVGRVPDVAPAPAARPAIRH
jgi:hypothetical protein